MENGIKQPEINSIIFGHMDKPVGKLYFENGKMFFSGDLDKSAEILFKEVCRMFNKNIPE